MKNFLKIIKGRLKDSAGLIAKSLGIKLLSVDQTRILLSSSVIGFEKEKDYTLPVVYDIAENDKIIFLEKEIVSPATYIWKHDNEKAESTLLRNGSLLISKAVIDTDFGNRIVIKDKLTIKKRKLIKTKVVIAPWTHYWSGYYDYIFFVIAKLVRIKRTISVSDWEKSVIAYPLLNTAFERELLSLIGITPEQRVDARLGEVKFETCILGNNSSWFYPNSTDVLLMKEVLHESLKPSQTASKRIYISRSGRRQVNNESALVEILKKHHVDIIEDRGRSIAEQAEIYSNASVIIGPHGASFANIIWCKPGTHLIELFPANYMPEYFRYLSHILGLTYSAYCLYPISNYGLVDHTYVNENIDVNIDAIDRFLSSLPAHII